MRKVSLDIIMHTDNASTGKARHVDRKTDLILNLLIEAAKFCLSPTAQFPDASLKDGIRNIPRIRVGTGCKSIQLLAQDVRIAEADNFHFSDLCAQRAQLLK